MPESQRTKVSEAERQNKREAETQSRERIREVREIEKQRPRVSHRTLLSFNGQFVPLRLSLSSGGVQRCIDVTENLSDGVNLARDQPISTQITHNTSQETDDECLAMVIP